MNQRERERERGRERGRERKRERKRERARALLCAIGQTRQRKICGERQKEEAEGRDGVASRFQERDGERYRGEERGGRNRKEERE
ncbi:MAG TPA: hypothetical protein V6C97_33195 [Oculatellaceae cyanobacterium]